MLECIPLFSSLNEQQITELETMGHERWFPKNSVVINEGDDTDSLFVVVSGKACAIRSDESGHQFVVNRFGPNDYFGEMSLFDGDARCATVVTKERCNFMIIPRKAFLDFAMQNPELLWGVIQALLKKLRKATEQIDALAFLDVYGRLARFFEENQNTEGIIEEKITQQELAEIVGSSRETVCRILNELISGEYVGKDKGRLVVKKKLPYQF